MTDHRAEADKALDGDAGWGPLAHLMAAVHDTLTEIRDRLPERVAEADAEHWRAEFNQADQRIVGLTAERDEWKARHAALRADVVDYSDSFDAWSDVRADTGDILDRDDERGGQA